MAVHLSRIRREWDEVEVEQIYKISFQTLISPQHLPMQQIFYKKI